MAATLLLAAAGPLVAQPGTTPEADLNATYAHISATDFAAGNALELNSHFTAQALISSGNSEHTLSTVTIDELLQRAVRDMQELDLARITMKADAIECKQLEKVAQCIVSLQTSFPGVRDSLVSSTASYNLHLVESHWLIASGTNIIQLPDSANRQASDFVVSYPVLWDDSLAGSHRIDS